MKIGKGMYSTIFTPAIVGKRGIFDLGMATDQRVGKT